MEAVRFASDAHGRTGGEMRAWEWLSVRFISSLLAVSTGLVGLEGAVQAEVLIGCRQVEEMLAINLPDAALAVSIPESIREFTEPEIQCIEELGVSEAVLAVVRSMEESPEAAARRMADAAYMERLRAEQAARAERDALRAKQEEMLAEQERRRRAVRADRFAAIAEARKSLAGDTYEDAVRRHEFISKQASGLSIGKWVVKTSMAPMDDTTSVFLSLTGENTVDGWLEPGKRPSLNIRCKEGEVDVYVVTGLASDPEGELYTATVRVRLDRNKPQTFSAGTSTSNDSLFLRDRDFLDRLRSAETMLFEFTPFNSSPVMVTFDLAGLGEAMWPLELACNVGAAKTAIQ